MGVRVGVANFFWVNQSIGIDETNTFQLQFKLKLWPPQVWAACWR